MRTLHLLRHAKSAWGDLDLADQDRPLSGRGRRAAEALAVYLRQSGVRPGLVLCSPALRTRQTLDLIAPGLGLAVTVRIEEEIYSGGADDVWRLVRALPDDVDEAMVIGHNPTLHDLATRLAGDGDDDLRARLDAKLPTGALVTLAWPGDAWAGLGQGAAVLHGYVRPRDL